MPQPKLFIITGISGSGKTTVARQLVEHGEVAFDSKLNHGLFHFVDEYGQQPATNHPNDPSWKQHHKWVINQTVFSQLLEEHTQSERVFLCGGGDSLKVLWPQTKKIFLLKIDVQTLLERLNNPSRDNAFAKNTATQEALLRRLEKYQQTMIESGATVIDARRPLDRVVDEIMELAQ
ncbi:MAG TPA: AAA family ATPase [Candidatus Saccharimonadia bacterium]|nr:AAA family ATPase [Candidatus Saccharimonadia bacterium]